MTELLCLTILFILNIIIKCATIKSNVVALRQYNIKEGCSVNDFYKWCTWRREIIFL